MARDKRLEGRPFCIDCVGTQARNPPVAELHPILAIKFVTRSRGNVFSIFYRGSIDFFKDFNSRNILEI